MSFRRTLWILCVLTIAAAAEPVSAQSDKRPWETAAPWVTVDGQQVPDGGMPRYIVPETPEQRKERLGMEEDPGINPDPKQVFRRFGGNFRINRFDRRWVKYTDRPGYVRPHPNVNITEELYQENEKWVWVWVRENAPRRSRAERVEALKYQEYDPKLLAYLESMRGEYEPLEPPKSDRKVRFEEASEGLPTTGSWRNSLAVADMNGDGFADIVAPPERGGRSGTPSIFLGNGKGKWSRWNVRWPSKLDYGSVVAADFDKDRKMDLAFGIHLSGVAILLGDGKGNFREVKREKKFPTRRIIAADVNADGWTDVVALYEGPIVRDKSLKAKDYNYLRAYLNEKKGTQWTGINVSGAREGVSGDWLVAANLNGDKYPDFVGSSMYVNATHTHYLSGAKGHEAFYDESATILPARGTYHAVTAGNFSSKSREDSVVASVRSWPDKIDPKVLPPPPLDGVISIDRLSFAGEKPVRTPVMRFSKDKPVYALNSGDFDGDGHEDLVFTRYNPREAVLLLGDGKGGFTRAGVEGVTLAPQENYDITVADVNGDKRPDLVIMYETDSSTAMAKRNGRIQVFLNRGTE